MAWNWGPRAVYFSVCSVLVVASLLFLCLPVCVLCMFALPNVLDARGIATPEVFLEAATPVAHHLHPAVVDYSR